MKRILIIAGIVLIVAVGGAILTLDRFDDLDNDIESTLPNISRADVNPTISFERTAIARFTENPTEALLSTPFYGEILFNEAVRFITETPTSHATGAAPECWLVADFWALEDLANAITEDISQSAVAAHVEVFTSVVWNAETCGKYLPVSNQITVWVDSPSTDDRTEIENALQNVINSIAVSIVDAEDVTAVSSNIRINIYFNTDSGQKVINTNWMVVFRAVGDDLSGQALIDALGEFTLNE